MGRYVPPESEGLTSANTLQKKHPLGSRASKSHLGILTVRFEMPFPIWCTSCPRPTIIGQGVRFNAQKRKVGMYHSTPVWAFGIKHAACGGGIEIRTDPGNTAYVVTEGARKRDTGEERVMDGDSVVLTEKEREERRDNAFVGLEGKVEEKERVEGARERISELLEERRGWEDPYEANRRLRGVFREGRKTREGEVKRVEGMKERLGLGGWEGEVLPETRGDGLRAGLAFADVDVEPRGKDEGRKGERERERGLKGRRKKKPGPEERKEMLARTVGRNTRVRMDPFLDAGGGGRVAVGRAVLGVKRKRGVEGGGGGGSEGEAGAGAVEAGAAGKGLDLLFAALNSNRATATDQQQNDDGLTIAPAAFDNNNTTTSPLQAPGSGSLANLDESPFIDYDYDFDNEASYGEYDFSNLPQGQMIGNLPGTSSDGDAAANESHDKRGLSDDEENDDEPDGKRREGDDKTSKKPGRKPLTSEPTSKRKAQNRAAQRAFRERKEKHLKDLETKVQDLEKASEAANHENLILRAKVDKMTAELKEYKQAAVSRQTGNPLMPMLSTYQKASQAPHNPNDVNFSFEFPKFGQLPGPPVLSKPSKATTSPGEAPSRSTSFTSNLSPLDSGSHNSISFGSNQNLANTNQSNYPGRYNGTQLEGMTNGNFDYMLHHNKGSNSASSADSGSGPTSTVCGSASQPIPRTMTSPPLGPSSTAAPNPASNSSFDINSLDWLAAQNGNQFDPQLFGDYREPHDNILTGLYDDSFFNEAFAIPGEFGGSPFTLDATPQTQNQQQTTQTVQTVAVTQHHQHVVKRDLIGEIDAQLGEEEVVPAESEMLTCTNMWEQIQACPAVQNGEIDMDSLCSQLQQKAKCSGEGPVIQETDFKDVLDTMFAPGGFQACPLTK
ncbi:hypothetical protein VE02_07577 [Pseudogymnoascus sp. 03VT05]|nr:hypothetical protein VE02_07577 [Pseudogymnoascus sp. 03VT05]